MKKGVILLLALALLNYLRPDVTRTIWGWLVPLVLAAALLLWVLRKRARRLLLGKRDLMKLSPAQFEQLTAEIMRGYGFRAKVSGQTGDGGIDVVLRTYRETWGVQCKRYQKPISAGMVRDFIGALSVNKMQAGYFVTTSRFTKAAKETAAQSPIPVTLMDGRTVAREKERLL